MKIWNSICNAMLISALALPCSSAAQTENRSNETIKITDQFKQACKVYKVHPTLHNGNLLFELGGKYGLLDFYGNVNVLNEYDKIVSSPKGIVGVSNGISYTFNSDCIEWVPLFNADDIKCDKEGTFIIYNDGEPVEKVILNDEGELESAGEYMEKYEREKHEDKKTTNDKTGKTGLADIMGKEIVPAIYDEVEHCYDDIYCVKLDGKYGLVKAGGEVIIPLEYEFLSGSMSYIAAEKNGKSGHIDITGKTIIPFEYDHIFHFLDEVTIAQKNGKYMLIDRTGRCITKHLYDELSNSNPNDFVNFGLIFHNGLLEASRNGKFGCVNKNGKETIPCIHEKISDLYSTIIAATKEGKTAFFDYTGKQLTPYKYDDYVLFSDGYSIVKKNGKYGCLYPNGTEFIPCEYDTIRYLTSWEMDERNSLLVNNSIVVEKDGKIGFYDYSGKETIAPKYDSLLEWSEENDNINYIVVEKNGKYGVVKNGIEAVPCSYDEIPEDILAKMDKSENKTFTARNKIYKPTPDDCFSVKEEKGKYGIENSKGKKIIPYICDDIVATPLVGGVIYAVITIDGWKHEGFIDSYGNHTFNERLFR